MQINYLKRKGYYACDWKELELHINGTKRLPKKTVMFHFDDGFLDNWSVVFPIMKEANFKYSVLITPEFIQKEKEPRKFVSKTNNANLSDWWGYLNEGEIKSMAESGLVDFQSHAYSHTWYPCSDQLQDVYTGDEFYPHIHWNQHVDKKPYWLGKLNELSVNKGYPVFEYKKSLVLDRAFVPNEEFIRESLNIYDSHLSKQENLYKLNELRAKFSSQGRLGVYETKQDAHNRIKKELLSARLRIAEISGKPCNYIVFPGGSINPKLLDTYKEFGYKLISKGSNINSFNSQNYQVLRQSGVYTFPIFNRYLNLLFLKAQLLKGSGNELMAKIIGIFR